MAEPAYTGYKQREQTEREQEIVSNCIKEFQQMQMWRNTFAAQWQEAAELIAPDFKNTFFYGNYQWPGMKKTERQIDASGMRAAFKFADIMDSLLTPKNMMYHTLTASNKDVRKDRQSQLWFEEATRLLFKYRYSEFSNFASQNNANFYQLGCFGNHGMFIDTFDNTMYPGYRGIRYMSMPLGEMFLRQNHQGLIDGLIRWVKMSADQAWQKWGHTGTFPDSLKQALENKSPILFDFIHVILPRDDYDPERLDERGLPYASYHICMLSKTLCQTGGYRMFPAAIGRYQQAPWEIYGRGPAQQVLPALKTLNAQKSTFLKQGHRIADPVLLTADDGIVGMSMRPGAVNKGGISPDGKLLVQTLPVGNIQINQEMMANELNLINDTFMVNLFQMALNLKDLPQMTATQVIEIMNQKGVLLAPTVGRQESEYLGPMVQRELDVLQSLGLLPEMPPLLKEAKGEYEIIFDSPLSRAREMPKASGFMRTLETVKELVSITQDASLLDPFDFDTAIPEIAAMQATPPSWMSTPEAIAQKRQQRAQSQERQQQIQEAPARAAMMKAQAQLNKSGQQPSQGQAPAAGGPPLQQQLQGA